MHFVSLFHTVQSPLFIPGYEIQLYFSGCKYNVLNLYTWLIYSRFICYMIIIRLDLMSQTTTQKIDIYKKQIIDFCQKWSVKEFSGFGSFLRNDFNEKSDVDVLMTFFQEALIVFLTCWRCKRSSRQFLAGR